MSIEYDDNGHTIIAYHNIENVKCAWAILEIVLNSDQLSKDDT